MLNSSGHDRREFIQRIAGTGAAIAASNLLGACATAGGMSSTSSTSPRDDLSFDMSWQGRLARHSIAYDSPEIMGGAALSYAAANYAGYRAVGVSSSDVTPVLILRHRASVMVLNDSIWDRMQLGEANKLNDPATGEPARRNPFINFRETDKHSSIDADNGLDHLISLGAVALACNYALTGVATRLKNKEPQRNYTTETALAELRRNVLPGCHVMPNGVFAVSAAQDAGCHYMRVLV